MAPMNINKLLPRLHRSVDDIGIIPPVSEPPERRARLTLPMKNRRPLSGLFDDTGLILSASTASFSHEQLKKISNLPLLKRLHVSGISSQKYVIPIPFTLQLPPKLSPKNVAKERLRLTLPLRTQNGNSLPLRSASPTRKSAPRASPKRTRRLVYTGLGYEKIDTLSDSDELSEAAPASPLPTRTAPPPVASNKTRSAKLAVKNQLICDDELSIIEEASVTDLLRQNSAVSTNLRRMPLRKPPLGPIPIPRDQKEFLSQAPGAHQRPLLPQKPLVIVQSPPMAPIETLSRDQSPLRPVPRGLTGEVLRAQVAVPLPQVLPGRMAPKMVEELEERRFNPSSSLPLNKGPTTAKLVALGLSTLEFSLSLESSQLLDSSQLLSPRLVRLNLEFVPPPQHHPEDPIVFVLDPGSNRAVVALPSAMAMPRTHTVENLRLFNAQALKIDKRSFSDELHVLSVSLFLSVGDVMLFNLKGNPLMVSRGRPRDASGASRDLDFLEGLWNLVQKSVDITIADSLSVDLPISALLGYSATLKLLPPLPDQEGLEATFVLPEAQLRSTSETKAVSKASISKSPVGNSSFEETEKEKTGSYAVLKEPSPVSSDSQDDSGENSLVSSGSGISLKELSPVSSGSRKSLKELTPVTSRSISSKKSLGAQKKAPALYSNASEATLSEVGSETAPLNLSRGSSQKERPQLKSTESSLSEPVLEESRPNTPALSKASTCLSASSSFETASASSPAPSTTSLQESDNEGAGQRFSFPNSALNVTNSRKLDRSTSIKSHARSRSFHLGVIEIPDLDNDDLYAPQGPYAALSYSYGLRSSVGHEREEEKKEEEEELLEGSSIDSPALEPIGVPSRAAHDSLREHFRSMHTDDDSDTDIESAFMPPMTKSMSVPLLDTARPGNNRKMLELPPLPRQMSAHRRRKLMFGIQFDAEEAIKSHSRLRSMDLGMLERELSRGGQKNQGPEEEPARKQGPSRVSSGERQIHKEVSSRKEVVPIPRRAYSSEREFNKPRERPFSFGKDVPALPKTGPTEKTVSAALPESLDVAEPPSSVSYQVDFTEASPHDDAHAFTPAHHTVSDIRRHHEDISSSLRLLKIKDGARVAPSRRKSASNVSVSSYQSSRSNKDTASTSASESGSVVIDLTKENYDVCIMERQNSTLSYRLVTERVSDGREVEVVLVDEEDEERDDLMSIYSKYNLNWVLRQNLVLLQASSAASYDSGVASEAQLSVKKPQAATLEKYQQIQALRVPAVNRGSGSSASSGSLVSSNYNLRRIMPPLQKAKTMTSQRRPHQEQKALQKGQKETGVGESNYFDYAGESYNFSSFMKQRAVSRPV